MSSADGQTVLKMEEQGLDSKLEREVYHFWVVFATQSVIEVNGTVAGWPLNGQPPHPKGVELQFTQEQFDRFSSDPATAQAQLKIILMEQIPFPRVENLMVCHYDGAQSGDGQIVARSFGLPTVPCGMANDPALERAPHPASWGAWGLLFATAMFIMLVYAFKTRNRILELQRRTEAVRRAETAQRRAETAEQRTETLQRRAETLQLAETVRHSKMWAQVEKLDRGETLGRAESIELHDFLTSEIRRMTQLVLAQVSQPGRIGQQPSDIMLTEEALAEARPPAARHMYRRDSFP